MAFFCASDVIMKKIEPSGRRNNVTKEAKQSIDYNYAFYKECPAQKAIVFFNGYVKATRDINMRYQDQAMCTAENNQLAWRRGNFRESGSCPRCLTFYCVEEGEGEQHS